MHRIQQIRYEACSKKKKKKTRSTLPGNVARGEFTVTLRGVWKHSTVTAMADADQSRRDPGIPPAGGDRDFSKQPPPSQPVGSKPGPGVGRGLSRGPMPDADGPNTKCPPLLGSNGARLAHHRMKTGAKGMSSPSAARIRPPPLVFTLQYLLYLVLELRTLQDHQDLDC